MTRKDYELIAKALKTQVEISRTYGEQDGELAVVNIARDLADALHLENPRFDRDRFMLACGLMSKCDKCAKPAKLFTSRSSACSEKHAPAWVASVRATA
jgi:hypothetical protein